MTELVSSSGNYCSYRKAFADCVGFKIPILGVHLKDLIAVHVIFPDWTDENKVNIVKMQQLSVTLSELVSLQTASHHLEPNMDLINLLTVSFKKNCAWKSVFSFYCLIHSDQEGGVGNRSNSAGLQFKHTRSPWAICQRGLPYQF